ncbi:MAG: phosphoribosylformylglycinamidine synthase subunit PurQ [Nanoarchaeota archaeon]|nr:phosphoribosylformylglycinamidine synthase subunit PurQ [Nanoarchaeota archaeon]
MKPKIIIPTGLGINSHEELKYCFELGGAEVDFRLINELVANPKLLENYQGMGLAGGFAMGDQLGAGQSLSSRIRLSGLKEKLEEKIDDVNFPIYSVCNSLQLMAKLNLFTVQVGTTKNSSGKHETSYWDIGVNEKCDTVWLSELKGYVNPIFAPISHGEGRIYVSEENLKIAQEQNIIALTYQKGHICDFFKSSRNHYNPNGSVTDIAGFGWNNNLVLFPHFERLHHDFQRPDRQYVKEEKGTTKGVYEPTYLMFKAAVDFMKGN